MSDDFDRPRTSAPVDDSGPHHHHRAAPTSGRGMPAIVMEHPLNHHREYIDWTSWLLVFLFGPFYLIYCQAWAAAIITVVVGVPSALAVALVAGAIFSSISAPGAAIVAYCIFYGLWALGTLGLIERSYLRRGWRRVSV